MPELPHKNDIKSDQSVSIRKRAVTNLLLMPLFLIALGILGLSVWNASLKWVTASDNNVKFLWGGVGIILIALEVLLSLLFINFTRWMITGHPLSYWSRVIRLLLPSVPNLSPPLKQRILSVIIMLPIFLMFDIALVIIAVTISWANGSILPLPRIILVSSRLITVLGGAYFLYLHVNYVYWVITGNMLHSWKNLRDWSLRP